MSMKKTMIYNSIGLGLIFLLFIPNFIINENKISNFMLAISFFFLVWILIWTVYYTVKAENFKKQIINWIDKS